MRSEQTVRYMTGKLNKHKCKKQLIFFVENALVAKETSVLKKNDTFATPQAFFCICKNAMAKEEVVLLLLHIAKQLV